jgi:hypothetical protein
MTALLDCLPILAATVLGLFVAAVAAVDVVGTLRFWPTVFRIGPRVLRETIRAQAWHQIPVGEVREIEDAAFKAVAPDIVLVRTKHQVLPDSPWRGKRTILGIKVKATLREGEMHIEGRIELVPAVLALAALPVFAFLYFFTFFRGTFLTAILAAIVMLTLLMGLWGLGASHVQLEKDRARRWIGYLMRAKQPSCCGALAEDHRHEPGCDHQDHRTEDQH